MKPKAGNDRKVIWPRLAAMAALQERHNAEIHPDWARQGYEYYRAIWIECAELLEHFGWKWWKKHEVDVDQVKLEVIDIWHFGLSELLRRRAVDENLAAHLATALARPPGSDFRLAVENLASASLASRDFDIDAFAAVMRALPLDFDELYAIYVGKNVLNSFRQAHGYGTGRYRKVWQGREDNEHLTELRRQLDAGAESYPEDLAAALAARYASSSA